MIDRALKEILDGRGPANRDLSPFNRLTDQIPYRRIERSDVEPFFEQKDWDSVARIAMQLVWLGKPLPGIYCKWFALVAEHARVKGLRADWMFARRAHYFVIRREPLPPEFRVWLDTVPCIRGKGRPQADPERNAGIVKAVKYCVEKPPEGLGLSTRAACERVSDYKNMSFENVKSIVRKFG